MISPSKRSFPRTPNGFVSDRISMITAESASSKTLHGPSTSSTGGWKLTSPTEFPVELMEEFFPAGLAVCCRQWACPTPAEQQAYEEQMKDLDARDRKREVLILAIIRIFEAKARAAGLDPWVLVQAERLRGLNLKSLHGKINSRGHLSLRESLEQEQVWLPRKLRLLDVDPAPKPRKRFWR